MPVASKSPFYNEDHEAFRTQAQRFVETEITPHVEAWEAAEQLPRELHRKAAEAGLLQIGFPERAGGIEVPDLFYPIILTEELARAGSGGVIASLMSHGIATPPVCHVGTPAQLARFAAPVLAGEKIAALAITEPSGGSDVASIKTTARRVLLFNALLQDHVRSAGRLRDLVAIAGAAGTRNRRGRRPRSGDALKQLEMLDIAEAVGQVLRVLGPERAVQRPALLHLIGPVLRRRIGIQVGERLIDRHDRGRLHQRTPADVLVEIARSGIVEAATERVRGRLHPVDIRL